jgi:hypothetical protein
VEAEILALCAWAVVAGTRETAVSLTATDQVLDFRGQQQERLIA